MQEFTDAVAKGFSYHMRSETIPGSTVEMQGHSHAVLGRYRLLSRLGSGGFGIVWKAFDEKLERAVAVKEIVAVRDGDRRSKRAIREAHAVARLSHPAIVSLYEYGREGNTTYLISELVNGRTLDELIAEGAMSDRGVALVGIDLCSALEHAHGAGVVHRDVKPQNVMVPEGDDDVGAKLMDFGVAHLAFEEQLTGTGDVVGTLMYMSPEQAKGRKITSAADVYSLSLTLYEALTGQNPVVCKTPAEAVDRIGSRLPSIGRIRRDLPDETSLVIDAGLDPDPEARPRLEELSRTLRESLGELDARPPGRPRDVRSGVISRLRTGAGYSLAGRGVSAVMIAVLAAVSATISSQFGAGEIAAVALIALAAGFVIPRLAWIAVAAAAVAAVAGGYGSGAALVLASALVPVPLLLARYGQLWSFPALVLPLGAAGIGPLFLAASGVLRSNYARAVIAAIASWWLLLSEVVTGSTLYLGAPSGTWSFERWQSSVIAASEHALLPLLAGPAAAVAVLWAVFALALPIFIRGRGFLLDCVGGIVWGTSFVMASKGLAVLLSGTLKSVDPRGTVIAALVVVLAIATFHLVRQARMT